MTSLAKQLQRLAVPHTQAILGEDKKKASLLFDPHEAANIDKETFYSLGLNGLEELQTIDPDFQEFEANLFAESSLMFERSVQTEDINKKLDATIKRFLIKISPYCLLKPAHKALEWLIHRFHIHFYNIDDLMLCFLPYHESKIYARVIQLIRLDSKTASKWDFLEPLQKSGLPLSRKTLMNHCATDVAFFTFVCNMVPAAVKVLSDSGDSPNCRVLFSFYATMVIGVLDSVNVSETLLSALIPHLSKGLKSSVLEYKASTYMILAQLLYKTKLETDILESLQNILAKGLVLELLSEGVSCLILMFQTQDMASLGITKKCFKYMCRQYTVAEVIAQLHEQFESKEFLSHFLNRLIPAGFKHAVGIATSGESSESDSTRGLHEYMSVLHRLLYSINLPEDVAENAAYKFLWVYIKHGDKYLEEEVNDKLKESLHGIVRQLEGKHSAAVDRAVSRTLSECESQEQKDLVHEFLNLYVLSVPHQLIADSETSLVLSLNHRLSSVREKAVKMLVQNKNNLDDETFVKESLIIRLKDEDPAVVLAALSIGQDLWSIINDDMVAVKLILKPILNGLSNPNWMKQAKAAVKILGGYNGNNYIDVFTSCLPCFYLSQGSKFNCDIISVLLNSALVSRSHVLTKSKNVWNELLKTVSKHCDDVGVVNTSLAKSLAQGLYLDVLKSEFTLVRDWTKQACKADDRRISCVMLLVLDSLVTMVADEKLKIRLCLLQAQLVSCLQNAEMIQGTKKVYDENKDWAVIIQAVQKEKKIPQVFLAKALSKVVTVIEVPTALDRASMWQAGLDEDCDVFLKLSVILYKLMLEQQSEKTGTVYRQLLQTIRTTCFKNTTNYMKFLYMLWTQHTSDHAGDLGINTALQARSLHLGLAILRSLTDEEITPILQSTQLIASLLIILTSEHVPIRNVGISYAKFLLTKAEECGSMFTNLIKKIVRCESEIVADSTFVKQVVASLFKLTQLRADAAPSPTKTPRTRSRRQSGTPSKKEEKQSALSAILDLIVADQSTPLYIQYTLLEVFSVLNNKDVLTCLLPFMGKLIERAQNTPVTMATESLKLIVKRFTAETCECLQSKSTGLELFVKCLNLHQKAEENIETPQMTAISQVTKELYNALDEEAAMEILGSLFDVCVDTKSIAVANLVRKTVKHLSVNGKHIEKELKKCIKPSSATTVREAKKQRVAAPDPEHMNDTEFDTRDWQRVNVVYEAVHNKKKLQNYTVLVPVCFQILSSILESDNHVSAEYLKQLVLSLLYNVCVKLDKLDEGDTVPEQQFKMDLIINCIRSSDNPQTHHHALLLLTAAAKIYPEHLLHNMMSVFTFMGANIMRQDDAYSFLIISKILETVVPALITACEQRKRVPKNITNDPDDIITMVIQVFVDSYPHIPQHRRQVLFNKLLTVIGVERYLWRTLLLMMKHVVTKGTLRAELTTDSQEVSSDTEFCLAMCLEFTSAVQLSSASEMIEYLIKLPDDKNDENSKTQQKVPESFGKLHKEDAMIFNVAFHTGKQLRHFKYAAINLLVNLFSNSDFLYQMTVDGEGELVPCFERVLESSLKLVSHVTNIANRSSGKPTAKYWKAFHHKSHDMLDKFVTLLPDDMFINVIGGLMSHDLPTVQRKAMELLNAKLQLQKDLDNLETSALVPMVNQLCGIVKKLCLGRDISEENSINSQTAFISLKLLCRHIGLDSQDEFMKVLKTAVDVFKHKHTNIQVAALALLCIAEIVCVFKVHVIQQLQTFMPVLIAVFGDKEKLYRNEVFLMSVITTVNKVVENLANFLSPYLHSILLNVSLLSAEDTDVEIVQKPAVQLRLKAIRTTLSNSLPTRVLLPIVTSCHDELVKSNLASVSSLMSLFGDHVSHITREDLLGHMTQLQTFFIQCLDIRTDYPKLAEETLSGLESVTIDTIITMVMKLSESTFKPFLFQIFDWATNNDEYRERILVFYKLADRLAEKLRSLFTLFAGHIIDHAAKMLEENNSIKQEDMFFPTDKSDYTKSNQLLDHIFDCINKCCLYDTDGFINRERFELLMQPVVDQLENQQGSDDVYETRINSHLVPCLVQLCVAAQDDSLWRSLNYQVCLKTRSQQSEVKLSALVTVDMLHRKLGDDYMPLLPDTVPFLAELMEDESEDVEKKCHEVIREMEKTLGEPLQKYF